MFRKIFNTLITSELKKKVFFTLLVIFTYRIGAMIPVPGVNTEAMKSMFKVYGDGILGFLNMFSGGALNRMSIFSLGVIPYINASIIMGLIQSAHIFPYFDKLSKEGYQGRKILTQITRFGTLLLGIIQSFVLAIMISKIRAPSGLSIVVNFSLSWIILAVITLVTGTIIIMWLGEQITERGIGNGISIIIFSGIVERLPHAVFTTIKLIKLKEFSIFNTLFLIIVIMAVLIFVIWIETAQRKIPIHYTKKIVGKKIYNKQTSFLPIKVDQSGVIAVIFAASVLSVPLSISQFAPGLKVFGFHIAKKIAVLFNNGSIIYNLTYAFLVIFFCYFYNFISFDTEDISENIKKAGGFIPGIRPGEYTSKYIKNVLEKITLIGALFVACIAVLPDYLKNIINVPFFFGGTSLLIIVGVSIDTIGQIESIFIMHSYEKFYNR
ncbi:MAG: preprotein translocase subunit SecY [Endomicrobium sp.]|jgi:preprotein translocase subunit SecY|nr:preprotein translocase subunit SecY [Endomicrobium sp.]